MGNLNTEQLKNYIMQELNKVIEKLPMEYNFMENNASSEEGIYIFSNEIGYHLVYSEKGAESSHKITDNKFEISFWTVNSIVRTLAINYMSYNIKQGENQRAVIFRKELELLEKIGVNYHKVGEIYIDEMLKENPL